MSGAPTSPLKIFLAATLFSVVVAHAHAGADKGLWMRGVFVGCSPQAQPVAGTEIWRQAAECAAQIPEAFVLQGAGESMRPLYPNGTILVCRRISYQQLTRGMTALYRNLENHIVAHVLVARARDGWRVAGLNNRIHDMEPVVAQNLVGVVVAAFTPARMVALSPQDRTR